MRVGIVGAEAAKFTARGEAAARVVIRRLLRPAGVVLVSGGCHLGGIDIWAEEEYAAIRRREASVLREGEEPRRAPIIHLPHVRKYDAYMARNALIARDSDVVHNIVVAALPPGFVGRRHSHCYHCDSTGHVKSGGCWTALRAERLGKSAEWHVILNEARVPG
jgi:hypothetical protein